VTVAQDAVTVVVTVFHSSHVAVAVTVLTDVQGAVTVEVFHSSHVAVAVIVLTDVHGAVTVALTVAVAVIVAVTVFVFHSFQVETEVQGAVTV